MRRSSRETALNRNLSRSKVSDQSGSLPQICPDIPGMTVVKFWKQIEAFNKRRQPVARLARPRLLDPVTVTAVGGPNEFGVNRSQARPLENGTPAGHAACFAPASNFRDGNSDRPATGTSCNSQVAFDEQ